jgi:hypothetical protein
MRSSKPTLSGIACTGSIDAARSAIGATFPTSMRPVCGTLAQGDISHFRLAHSGFRGSPSIIGWSGDFPAIFAGFVTRSISTPRSSRGTRFKPRVPADTRNLGYRRLTWTNSIATSSA